MSDFDGNSLQSQFFQEALDMIPDAEKDLLGLEDEGFDKEKINSLFRTFHTLKGNANMVGEIEISSLCHAIESRFDEVRKEKIELDGSLLQLAFEVIDLLNAAAEQETSDTFIEDIEYLIRKIGLPRDKKKSSLGKSVKQNESNKGEKKQEKPAEQASPETDTIDFNIPPEELEKTAQKEDPAEGSWEQNFKEVKPFLKCFFSMEKIAQEFITSEDSGLLMDLGMAVIETHSSVPHDLDKIYHLTLYQEKYLSTMVRHDIPYDPIDYELFYILLDELRNEVQQLLNSLGLIEDVSVSSVHDFEKIKKTIIKSNKLFVIYLQLNERSFFKDDAVIASLTDLAKSAPARIIYISVASDRFHKATALLSQALDDFPLIFKDRYTGIVSAILMEE